MGRRTYFVDNVALFSARQSAAFEVLRHDEYACWYETYGGLIDFCRVPADPRRTAAIVAMLERFGRG